MSFSSLIAQGSSNTRRQKTITVAGLLNTTVYVPGGIPLDLTAITDPQFQGSCFPGQIPTRVEVKNQPGGYNAEVIKSAVATPTLATAFLFKVYTAMGTELTGIAPPVILNTDPFILALVGPNWGF